MLKTNKIPSDGTKSQRIQTMEVVKMAAMVPIGMEREASARSPDLLDPAIIPAEREKEMVNLNTAGRHT